MSDEIRVTIMSITQVIDHLADALKMARRDPREPRRKEKEDLQKLLIKIFLRRWSKQKKMLRERLQLFNPGRKNFDNDYGDIFSEDDNFREALIRVIVMAIRNGVTLFEESSTIPMDYTMTNQRAAEIARKHVGDLIKGVDETSLAIVRQQVEAFISNPGYTLRDVIDNLPFDDRRAATIAVTEITRAYSEGEKAAARDLKKEYPDVRVTLTWYTNNDDRVCDICGPLDGKEVDQGEDFADGIDSPPAHVNCRCWTDTRTRING